MPLQTTVMNKLQDFFKTIPTYSDYDSYAITEAFRRYVLSVEMIKRNQNEPEYSKAIDNNKQAFLNFLYKVTNGSVFFASKAFFGGALVSTALAVVALTVVLSLFPFGLFLLASSSIFLGFVGVSIALLAGVAQGR